MSHSFRADYSHDLFKVEARWDNPSWLKRRLSRYAKPTTTLVTQLQPDFACDGCVYGLMGELADLLSPSIIGKGPDGLIRMNILDPDHMFIYRGNIYDIGTSLAEEGMFEKVIEKVRSCSDRCHLLSHRTTCIPIKEDLQ